MSHNVHGRTSVAADKDVRERPDLQAVARFSVAAWFILVHINNKEGARVRGLSAFKKRSGRGDIP